MERLKQLYIQLTGHEPTAIEQLSGAGSNRRYFRLMGEPTLIGVRGESSEENQAFIYMSHHFHEKGLPVPQVLIASNNKLHYLQEDLGNTLLFDRLEQGRNTGCFSEEEKQLLRKTIRQLPVIQFTGAEGMDFSHCYPQAAFNRRSILWDLNYFKYCFLKASGVEFQENRLEDDFERMADLLLQNNDNTFLYRDFQSRNVMIKEGEPWFIDFQGGRRGPYYYDVASFLWQAKANYSDALRQELLNEYINALRAYRPVDEAIFYDRLRHFVLFRTMQVLGAYGFRGYFEKKPHFLQSIPFAIANLRRLLQEPYIEYPHMCEVLTKLSELKQFSKEAMQAVQQPPKEEKPLLTVEVTSFSYKKGIPEDTSGNGGGFVFDCRAIHNPGRYEPYKLLTGQDEPVIRFLEEDGEIITFLQHVNALVDASVQRYMQRGFTHLSVNFGCTGGQHRSVYCAQHVAEHLHRKFGIQVKLLHREQHIEQVLKSN